MYTYPHLDYPNPGISELLKTALYIYMYIHYYCTSLNDIHHVLKLCMYVTDSSTAVLPRVVPTLYESA